MDGHIWTLGCPKKIKFLLWRRPTLHSFYLYIQRHQKKIGKFLKKIEGAPAILNAILSTKQLDNFLVTYGYLKQQAEKHEVNAKNDNLIDAATKERYWQNNTNTTTKWEICILCCHVGVILSISRLLPIHPYPLSENQN